MSRQQKGFSTLLVIIIVLVLVAAVLVTMSVRKTEPVVVVDEVSESVELGVIEKEIDETLVEFPDADFKEMETEAASL